VRNVKLHNKSVDAVYHRVSVVYLPKQQHMLFMHVSAPNHFLGVARQRPNKNFVESW
jgi:hypothetical protein